MKFTLKATFNATPQAIYQAWLNSEEHTQMTGGEAQCTPQVGAQFTAWDGYISGQNIELTTNQRIVQCWRTTEFTTNEPDSLLEIILNDHNGHTELILTHSNLPTHGEQYQQGWEDHYFEPMRAFFN